MLSQLDDSREIFSYAAGGFRDFTRIASSDPVMWRDISIANHTAIVKMLKKYRKELDKLIADVSAGNGTKLQTLFGNAKAARDALVTDEQKKD
jgi:prephenate dehydrogenase